MEGSSSHTEKASFHMEKGYVWLNVADNDIVTLTLNGTPYFVYASPKVPQLTGKAAICRGPLVYCFEGIDNGGDVLSLAIKDDQVPSVFFCNGLPKDTVALSVNAVRKSCQGGLYGTARPVETPCQAISVPYYTWGNRGENQMRVWMDLR